MRIVYFVAAASSVSCGDTRDRSMLLLEAFWCEEFQHALLLLCASSCAHLAAANALPQAGQRAEVDLRGRLRLFLCSLILRPRLWMTQRRTMNSF